MTLVVTVYVTFLKLNPRLCMIIQHHKMDRMILMWNMILKVLLEVLYQMWMMMITMIFPLCYQEQEMVYGVNVLQLFTLMIGSVSADRIYCRKPTGVIYSSVFVVDLTCIHCIDDLHAGRQ